MTTYRATIAAAALAFSGLLTACGEGAEDGAGIKERERTERMAQSSEDTAPQTAPDTAPQTAADSNDPYLWLEEVEGKRPLEFVRQLNQEALAKLTTDPRYEKIRTAAEAVYTASDRIPYGEIVGEQVDNFWQDEDHVRGIWRRTALSDYASDDPSWTTVLDLDALAEKEGENWVWKGKSCLPPDHSRCLVRLSRGGADAVEIREFDTEAGAFVEDGFFLEEEKQWTAWVDADTVLVASPYAGGSKNSSGYPRSVRLWSRGAPLAEAGTVFTGEETDAFAFPASNIRPEGTELFIVRAPDFFHETVFHLAADGTLTELPLPGDVDFQGVIDGWAVMLMRTRWDSPAGPIPQGAAVTVPLAELLAGEVETAEFLVAPTDRITIDAVSLGRDAVYVSILENVTGKLVRAVRDGAGWANSYIAVPEKGTVSVVSADAFNSQVLVNFENYLQPDTLYLVAGEDSVEPIKSLPPKFDAEPYAVEQHMALSEDGTEIPYFLVRAEDMDMDGTTPTILYGYGGFEVAITPGYLSPLAVEWLERGGAYAVANIRGGGEFGPAWHQAALKENRSRAFADFAAVAADLAERDITGPEHLGIYGGSNGGLLVTATMVRYPQRFGAVTAAVPLIDMLRYHKLLAGASWIGEYGNPDIPEERAFIEGYSPYQNVTDAADYPPLFLTTSTRDDRVHPGHARKMAAKMADMGHEVLYYENIEGGHSAAANLRQRARRDALVATFFLQELKGAAGS